MTVVTTPPRHGEPEVHPEAQFNGILSHVESLDSVVDEPRKDLILRSRQNSTVRRHYTTVQPSSPVLLNLCNHEVGGLQRRFVEGTSVERRREVCPHSPPDCRVEGAGRSVLPGTGVAPLTLLLYYLSPLNPDQLGVEVRSTRKESENSKKGGTETTRPGVIPSLSCHMGSYTVLSGCVQGPRRNR